MLIKKVKANGRPKSGSDPDEGTDLMQVDFLDDAVWHTPAGHRTKQWLSVIGAIPGTVIFIVGLISGSVFFMGFGGIFALVAVGSFLNHKDQADKYYKTRHLYSEAVIQDAPLINTEPVTNEISENKTCPLCAETIKRAAIVCKHCGRDLPIMPPVT